MTTELPTTLMEAAAWLRAGRISSGELTELALRRTSDLQPALGAFVTVTADAARAAAARADADLDDGVDRGPLHGIPIAVKDVFATSDAPTFANSRAFVEPWPPGYDAPAVARLRTAGAVLIGKATAGEFGCGEPEPGRGFPLPRNPWNPEHTPAGSSSGSAIAVAAGMALGALGTDTGGSVRAPAAVTGLTGLCTTRGRIPTDGVVPLSWSMDALGVIGRSAADCAAMLQILSDHEPHRRMQAPTLDGDLVDIRIGLVEEYFLDDPGLQAEVLAGIRAAIGVFGDLGAQFQEIRIEGAHQAKEANTVIVLAEGFTQHRANLALRWSDYGAAARSFLARGAFLSAADYAQAQQFRREFRMRLDRLFRNIDAVLLPCLPTDAGRIDQTDLEARFRGRNSTRQWNLAGVPAVSVPCGFGAQGLPIAFQLIGPSGSDERLLQLAMAYQTRTDWHLRRPPMLTSTGPS